MLRKMAVIGLRFSLLSLLFLSFAVMDSAAEDCSNLIVLNMAECLLSNGSMVEDPGENCCLGLRTLLETGTECLCEALNNSAHLGLTLNLSFALTLLPSACHFSSLSIGNSCDLASIGIGAAPDPSPSALSPSSVAWMAPSACIGTNGTASSQENHHCSSSSSMFIFPISFKVLALTTAAAALSLTLL